MTIRTYAFHSRHAATTNSESEYTLPIVNIAILAYTRVIFSTGYHAGGICVDSQPGGIHQLQRLGGF